MHRNRFEKLCYCSVLVVFLLQASLAYGAETFSPQIQNDLEQSQSSSASQSNVTGQQSSQESSTETEGEQLTAEEIQAEQEVNVNNYLSEAVGNEPQTQQELISQLDVFLDLQFRGALYSESNSIGDLKMIIQDRFIKPNEEINFLVFEQHIDESYDFEGAEFTWTVKKGFTELFTLTEADKNTFFYTFDEVGTYGVDVVVRFPDGRELSSLITFTVLEPLTIDYQPFDIGAGDQISLFTERSIPNSEYRWIVDDTEVNTNSSEFTFQEFKGQGTVYDVQLYVRNLSTSQLTHFGAVEVKVGVPEAWIYLTDIERGVEIDYAEAVRIGKEVNLSIQIEPRGFGDDPLEYRFRVNDQNLETDSNEVELFISPEEEYRIEVLVRNSDSSKFSVKSFVINQTDPQDALQANVNNFWAEVRGRYLSLGVFLSIVGISMVWIRIANT